MEAARMTGVRLTEETMRAFLEEMQNRDCKTCSLSSYRQVLSGLADYLSPDGRISETTIREWKVWMEKKGYSRRTINARISVFNSFLKYMGKREWQETDFSERSDAVQPELTRSEYVRLLKTAKALGKEREYLLIKTMGSAGVRIQELECVTVEAVQEGFLQIESYNRKRFQRIPDSLRKELEAYATREGILKGPIFVARDGSPMARSTIWHCVSSISGDARVDDRKVNPRSLCRMYTSTWEGLESNVQVLVEQMYDRILRDEQLEIGWEN